MGNALRDTTSSILTTFKVQALIDSGLNPEIRNRKRLAHHMTCGGDKISVHGIEGWFKHVDSNYSMPRESLHPDHHSYAIPKRRWAIILSLFCISSEDVELNDLDFQKMSFSRAKTNLVNTSPSRLRANMDDIIYAIYATKDLDLVSADMLWLRHQGLNLWWDTSLADDADWSDAASTVIEKSSLCLIFVSKSFVNSNRCMREFELAKLLGRPIMAIHVDGESIEGVRFQNQISFDPQQSSNYLAALFDNVVNASASGALEPSKSTEQITDCPSIAVLPFSNLTGVKDVNYLAQGLTEDIITLLSRVSDFFVVSRFASHKFAGMLVNHQTIANEFKVSFVLEGSIRKTKDKLRINCLLSDLTKNQQVWAEQFECVFEQVWEVQDEITTKVLAKLHPKLVSSSLDYGSRTSSYEAWRCWQLGLGSVCKVPVF